MAADKKPSSGEDAMIMKTALGLGGALMVVFSLLPALVAAGLFFALRKFFRKRDYIVMLAGSLVVLMVARGSVGAYFSFVTDFLTGNRYITIQVAFAVVVLSLVMLAIAGLAQGTSVAAKIPNYFRPKALGDKPSLIPTIKERQQLTDVTIPQGSLQSPLGHSIMEPAKPGDRMIVLGVSLKGAPIGITEREIGTHALVFGSTGSGKSETIKTLAGGLLDLGWDGIILDLKEDTKAGGLRDWCETYSHSHAIAYQELRLSDPQPTHWFDSLSGLSQDEARDTILSLSRFDDEYYKNISIKVLGQLLKLRFWAHEVDPVACPLPTLYDVAMALSAPSLQAATKKHRAIVQQARPDLQPGEFQVLESPSQVEQTQASSWGAKLGNLYETSAGRLVLRTPGPTENREKIDVTQSGLLYFGLDSLAKPDLTKIVSSSVLQRISAAAGQRTTGQAGGVLRPKFLIVDEANWVDRTIVQNLLSRARSAGIAMVLSTQGPKDWIDKDGNDFARLAQNTNVALIMKQGEPESAQICADFIGTMQYKRFTERVEEGSMSGSGSLMERMENVVDPEEMRGLGVGEAILRVSTPHVRREWLRVTMRDPSAHYGQPSATVPQSSYPSPASSRGASPLSRRDPNGGHTPGLARPPL